MQVINLDIYVTFLLLFLVLLIGNFVTRNIPIFNQYAIPDAVVGGIFFICLLLIIRLFANIKIELDTSMKEPCMLAFFSAVGLLADISLVKRGGQKLVIFLSVIVLLLILQNIVGVSLAIVLGYDSFLGLLAGSVSMGGGHGNAIAWGTIISNPPYNYSNALEIAFSCATFGLILGGIIGGPVATYLIRKNRLKDRVYGEDFSFEQEAENKLDNDKITHNDFIKSMALISFCLFCGVYISKLVACLGIKITLPAFVYSLIIGVIIRNLFKISTFYKVHDKEVGLIGNVSLSLFLAYIILGIDLIQLADLALPILTILLAQIILIVLYAIFIAFRICGKNYDAAVMTAGLCGFGMGATPTAMVNMQAVCKKYGMSQLAFIIVPISGAFLIDILNAVVINLFLIIL